MQLFGSDFSELDIMPWELDLTVVIVEGKPECDAAVLLSLLSESSPQPLIKFN